MRAWPSGVGRQHPGTVLGESVGLLNKTRDPPDPIQEDI